MTQLEVGFATRDITPVAERQTIYHSKGVSTRETPVRDPLYARCVACRRGAQTAAWVTVDLLCVSGELRQHVVDALAGQEWVGAGLVLGATHTHTAPSIINFHGREPTPDSYLSRFTEQTADAVREALETTSPATVSFGCSTANISVNRREIGRMRDINDLNAPTGLVDRGVRVVRIDFDDRRGAALLFNYAAHPLTMAEGVPLISADFPGQATRILEERDSVLHAQFLQGCAGNVNVKISGNEHQAETAGRILAEAVLEAAEAAEPSASCELRTACRTVRLPWARIPTIGEARELLDSARTQGRVPGMGRREGAIEWAEKLCRTLEAGHVPPHAEVLVQATRLGDAVLVALPGEVFAEIGMAIQRQVPAQHVLVVAYANSDEIGYVPTAAAFPEGGYEVDSAPYYYGLFQLAPDCEALLVKAGIEAAQAVSA